MSVPYVVRTRAYTAAFPLTATGSELPAVQDTAEGVRGTFGTLGLTVNGQPPLVPPPVCTTSAPLNAPAGTVVMMYVLVQSLACAIGAASASLGSGARPASSVPSSFVSCEATSRARSDQSIPSERMMTRLVSLDLIFPL